MHTPDTAHWSLEFAQLRVHLRTMAGPLIQVDSRRGPLTADCAEPREGADRPAAHLSYTGLQRCPAQDVPPSGHAPGLP